MPEHPVDTVSSDREQTGIALSPHAKESIARLDRCVVEAMAELGAAYLRHRETEAAFKRAQAQISQCSAAALEAERKRSRGLSELAAKLNLPPGRWTFDAEQGTLVKEAPHDADQT